MDFTNEVAANGGGGGGDGGESVAVDGVERFPAPEVATPEDVHKYNMEFVRNNPVEAAKDAGTDDPTMPLPFNDEEFRKDLPGAKQKADFPWLSDPKRGVPWDFNPVELRNLAQANTWVGMLVQSITTEISEVPFTITDEEDRQESAKRLGTHPEERTPVEKDLPDATAERIFELLHDPNPDDNWQDMVEMWLADMLEVGSLSAVKAFPERDYSGDEFTTDPASTEPLAIQTSAPEVWTKDYHDRTGVLNGYWQFDRATSPGSGTSDGTVRSRRGFMEPTFFDSAEMVWNDIQPRSNRRYGMPPTLLVKDFLQSIDLAVTQEQQYLSRGSIPSGAWVFENWDRNQVKEWKEENAENVKGKPHKSLMFAGRGGDVRFEPMSMNFKELEFTERMRWYARVVASVFQVPTAVVGIEPEQINYHTFQGERENFEANTLGPYLQELERVINDQIIRPHWPGYRFEFKPGMSESTRGMISERARSEFNDGLITRSEARREIGKEPLDDGDMADDGFAEDVLGPGDESNIKEARVRSLRLSGVGTVNEAREEMGLSPLDSGVGDMTLAEFEAEFQAAGGDGEEEVAMSTDGERGTGNSTTRKGDPTAENHQVDPGTGVGLCENTGEEFEAETFGDIAGDCPHCGDPISHIDPEDLDKTRKDGSEPLRDTDEWWMFDVQPSDVEELQEEIAEDVEELFSDVLDDPDLQAAIEELDPPEDGETAKSLNDVSDVVREKLESNNTAQAIASTIQQHTAEQVAESMQEAVEEADSDDAPDAEAIQSRLEDRSVEFADAFANRMSAEVRDTVAEGWEEGKGSREIAADIGDMADMNEGWTGAERIARQEMQIASGEARNAVAEELGKVRVWRTSGDDRVRDAHGEMDGKWVRPGESFVVDYSARGRGVKKESVPGDSRPGIGCRCLQVLRDRDEVDASDYAGEGSP